MIEYARCRVKIRTTGSITYDHIGFKHLAPISLTHVNGSFPLLTPPAYAEA